MLTCRRVIIATLCIIRQPANHTNLYSFEKIRYTRRIRIPFPEQPLAELLMTPVMTLICLQTHIRPGYISAAMG